MPHANVIKIDDSADMDIADISAIYGYWVRHGVASFELEPPTEAEMMARRESVLRENFPYLAAVRPIGASSASPIAITIAPVRRIVTLVRIPFTSPPMQLGWTSVTRCSRHSSSVASTAGLA
jgi:hypothetical protein